MNEAFHLSRLQKIDSQIDQIDHRLEEIDRQLKDDQVLKEANEQARLASIKLDQAYTALRQCEEAAKAQQIKIELNDASLYGGKVRNPKELQDLQNEAAALRRHLAVLEDQQLEVMMALEEAEQANQFARQRVTQATGDFATRSASILGEQSKLQKDKERLQAERAPAVSQIAPANLDSYYALRKQKRGLAVAGIVDGSCTACGSTLPPAEWQAARSPHRITYCSSCGRILYAG